jgi:UDP-N-acetylmuramyl pentapeptide phosphotransferase/UDP-N-acetylglucosamine-1-phosphate transferase/glycosyltransferase involved in cell wall biosynthesis
MCLFCGGFALLLVLCATPLLITCAATLGLLDVPGFRKIHRKPVPRLGGLAIALSALAPFAAILITMRNELFMSHEQTGMVLTLLFAATCVLGLGLIDDLGHVGAKFKFLVLLGAAATFCGSGGLIHAVTFEGKTLFGLGLLSWPITLLWLAAVTVSVNFIDGLDGLASGIVVCAFGVLATGAAMGGQTIVLLLCISMIGALLGFLVFNFNPATVFMGDSGSLFIGFTLAGCCVLASHGIGTTRGIILPSLTLSIPLLDCVLTMVRRGVIQRQSLFAAERGHIHHRLLDIGLIHHHVVLLLYGVTLTAAAVALVEFLGSIWATVVTAFGFCIALAMLFRTAGSVRARETLTAIRRNRAIGRETRRYQAMFNELRLGFQEAASFEAWWRQICACGEKFNFAKINLPLTRRDGTVDVRRWRRVDTELAEPDSIAVEVPIPQRRSGESLRMEVEVIASMFLEHSGQRVALFSRLMGEFSLANLPSNGVHVPIDEPRTDGDYVDATQLDPSTEEVAKLFTHLKVAIVHDFLYTYGGAERVLEQLIVLFPKADLFSLFDFLPENMRGFMHRKTVNTTFLQRMPLARRRHRAYLPLMPLAIEQLDLSAYDLVLSSSYMVAKGVLTRPDQLHICYCHTPVRYAWDVKKQQLKQGGPISAVKSVLARLTLHYIRNWDVRSANNVDVFVANSDFVGRRINKYYRRPAKTVYPPVNMDWFALGETKEDFYLTVSRLVPYKRVDLIVDAFNAMPERRLFVIGDGPELASLTAKAGPNVHLIGFQTPERLRHYLRRAKAFVFAAEEDFGIAPVESLACGTPVIAFGRGGVTESVVHLKTGYLFAEQTVESLMQAIKAFEKHEWDPAAVRQNAEKFSIKEFHGNFMQIVKSEWTKFLADRIEANRPGAMQEALGDLALPRSGKAPEVASAVDRLVQAAEKV